MGDHDAISNSSRSKGPEKVCFKNGEQTGNDVNEFEHQLKKIWLHSSGKRFKPRYQMSNKGINNSSSPAVSKLNGKSRMKVDAPLSTSAANGKNQVKLNDLIGPKNHFTEITHRQRHSVDSFCPENEINSGDSPTGDLVEPSKPSEKTGEPSIADAEAKKYLLTMSSEIVRYELRLASLHGKMAALIKENERLRDDRALQKILAEQLVQEAGRGETRSHERQEYSSNEDSDSGKTNAIVTEVSADEGRESEGSIQLAPKWSKNNEAAYKRLRQLESRVLKRLEEYKRLAAVVEDKTAAIAEDKKDLLQESPFLLNLKIKLIKQKQELTHFRMTAKRCVLNLQMALRKEQTIRYEIEEELLERKGSLQRWESYATNANRYVQRCKTLIEERDDLIKSLKEKEQVLRVSMNSMQLNLEKMTESYQSVTKNAEASGKDSQHLTTQLDSVKVENQSLKVLVQRQKKQIRDLTSLAERRLVDDSTLDPVLNGGLQQLDPPHVAESESPASKTGGLSLQPLPPLRTIPDQNVTTPRSQINNDVLYIKQESPGLILPNGEASVTLESPTGKGYLS